MSAARKAQAGRETIIIAANARDAAALVARLVVGSVGGAR